MRLIKLFALLSFVAMGITACGSGVGNPQLTQADYDKVIATKSRIYPMSAILMFWPWMALDSNPRLNADIGKKTTPEINNPSPTPAPVSHLSMVTGKISVSNNNGNPITLQALESESCDQGHCQVPGKPFLASVVISSPGFFSIVIPNQGQEVLLNASQSGGMMGQAYLGTLENRVDDVEIHF
jgi:hypothetical protein